MVVCALLPGHPATLALSYRSHRAEALAVSLSLLGSNLPSGPSGCTGAGSMKRRPAVLHAGGGLAVR